MSGKIRVDVPPLPEPVWSRVEKGVFERLPAEVEGPRSPQPSRWGMWLAAAATVALVFACVIVWWPSHAIAPVSAPSSALPAPAPNATSHIVTTEGPTRVSFGDSSLDVGPASELVATGDDDRGVLVVLERGSVRLHVPARAGRPPLTVQAGDVRVQVVGTRFSVTRAGSDVGVHVDDGVVRVISGAEVTELHVGEDWPPAPAASTQSNRALPAQVDDQALFERAARSERTDPEGAIAIYGRIAARTGPWAANALFARGRLELDRGHATEGRRLLDLYLKRYPHGANAADAKSLLER